MRRLLALLITLTFVPAATAVAGGGDAVIRDCTDDGTLQGRYTQRQLREALSSMPSDVDEYTNCRDVIRGAAIGGAGGSKGGGGSEFGGFKGSGGGGDPLQTATPQEREAVAKATKEGGGPIQLSDEKGRPLGKPIRPAQVARRTGPGSTDVPAPLLIAAILLALAALAAAAPTLGQRVLPRRGA